jgi:predicted DNA-binding protein
MGKFVIDKTDRKMSSISRTIRMKEETFDRINEINRQTGVSFNKIVNQCIEYALAHYDDEKQAK